LTVLRILVKQPLQGIRIHRVPTAGETAAPRAIWLMSLREAQVREVERHNELVSTLDAIRHAAERLPGVVARSLDSVVSMATEIGLAVAREIVGEAVIRGAVDPTPTVRRCLEEAVVGLTGAQLEVRLHPEDLSQVMTELEGESALRSRVEQTRFIPDPTLSRSAVRIDTDTGRLRYDCAEVLARISDEVRGAMAQSAWGDRPPAGEAAAAE